MGICKGPQRWWTTPQQHAPGLRPPHQRQRRRQQTKTSWTPSSTHVVDCCADRGRGRALGRRPQPNRGIKYVLTVNSSSWPENAHYLHVLEPSHARKLDEIRQRECSLWCGISTRTIAARLKSNARLEYEKEAGRRTILLRTSPTGAEISQSNIWYYECPGRVSEGQSSKRLVSLEGVPKRRVCSAGRQSKRVAVQLGQQRPLCAR